MKTSKPIICILMSSLCISMPVLAQNPEKSVNEKRQAAMKEVLIDPNGALEGALKIENSEQRSYVMDGMVSACSEHNPMLAEKIWRAMGEKDARRPYTIAYVIQGWAARGEVNKALELIQSIDDVNRRGELMAAAVQSLIGGENPHDKDRLREAEALALKIDDQTTRNEQLKFLALSWTAQDSVQAARLARSIKNPDSQIDALLEVARTLSAHDAQKAAELSSTFLDSVKDQEQRKDLLRTLVMDAGGSKDFWRWSRRLPAQDQQYLKEVEQERQQQNDAYRLRDPEVDREP